MTQRIPQTINQFNKPPQLDKRNAEIYQDHVVNGMSYSELSFKHHITASRIGAIIKREKSKRKEVKG